jgi:hypothetical protein
MSELHIPSTVNTPLAIFDRQTGILLIEGRCIPENPADFFGNITRWVEESFPALKGIIKINIHLEYINSGSSKQILNFLRTLELHDGKGDKSLMVNWYFEEDDEAIQELGQDIKGSLKIEMNLIVTE